MFGWPKNFLILLRFTEVILPNVVSPSNIQIFFGPLEDMYNTELYDLRIIIFNLFEKILSYCLKNFSL